MTPRKRRATAASVCIALAVPFFLLAHHHSAFVVEAFVLSSSSSATRRTKERRGTPPPLHGCSVELIDPETGTEIVLLGCFHGSKSSAADVEAALNAKPTDVVVLELCASRFSDLRKDLELQEQQDQVQVKPWIQRYGKMVLTTAKSQGLPTAVAAAVLGGVSGLQTTISNLQPGLEFASAMRIASDKNMDIVLADQNVDTTLQKIGELPWISLAMWKDLISGKGWNETFGREAVALKTALLGRDSSSITLPAFLTRSDAAKKDLLRLTVAPLLILQLFNLAATEGLGMLVSHPALAASSSVADSVTASDPIAGAAVLMANFAFVAAGFISTALPATRVVLRERDDQLTEGIRAACRNSNDSKRVVAVLGLLHVNGVAERLLTPEKENSEWTSA